MDLELFPLLVGAAIGALFGATGKPLVKRVLRGYFDTVDRAGRVIANARNNGQEMIEEARYEVSEAVAPRRRGRRPAASTAADEGAGNGRRTGRGRGRAAQTTTGTRGRRTRRANTAEGGE